MGMPVKSDHSVDHGYTDVHSVKAVESALVEVTSFDRIFLVSAPPASEIAGLTNFDAHSENWSCQFEPIPGPRLIFSATNCSSIRK
jgi:hypothetical protein